MLAAFSPFAPFTMGSQVFLGREICPEIYWLTYPPPSPVKINYQECYAPPGSASLIKISGEDVGPKGAYLRGVGDQTLFGLWEAGLTQYPTPESADTLILETGDICIGIDEEFVWSVYPPLSPVVFECKTSCIFQKDPNNIITDAGEVLLAQGVLLPSLVATETAETNTVEKDLVVDWNPSFATTELWLDAADSGTTTESGGSLSSWADKSGNGRDAVQATSGDQPLLQAASLNSLPTVSFDGVSQTLEGNWPLEETLLQSTIFAVVNVDTAQARFGRIAAFVTDPSSLTHMMLVTGESGGFCIARDDKVVGEKGTGLYGVWHQIAAQHITPTVDGGTIYADGLLLTATESLGSYGGAGGLVGGQYALGSRIGSGYCNVSVAELIMVPGENAEAQRQLFEGYLAHKWGLTAGLPAEHPYKAVAPTI